MEITTAEQKKEKRMKTIEDSLRDLWDNSKHTNIRVPGEEEKNKGIEKIFEEFRVENFPNMGKERVNQVQEVQRVPYVIFLLFFANIVIIATIQKDLSLLFVVIWSKISEFCRNTSEFCRNTSEFCRNRFFLNILIR